MMRWRKNMKAIGHQMTEEMAAILDALKDAINQLGSRPK
jgi:hypothetical protein